MKNKLHLGILICLLLMQQARASQILVTSNADNGPGTLRAAIDSANAKLGLDTIYFNLATDVASRTITLASSLTALAEQTVIDASTQPGNYFGVSTAKVQVTSVNRESAGITIAGDSCSIFGLYINNFETGILVSKSFCTIGQINGGNVISDCSTACIKIQFSDHDIVRSNLIGIDTTGHPYNSVANGLWCVDVTGLSVGGKLSAAKNVISGNLKGVYLQDVNGANFNGNYIGTKLSGEGKPGIPNDYGIYADGLNYNITIGPDSLGGLISGGNVISGNNFAGIYGTFYNSIIQSNLIGADKKKGPLGNGSHGIYLATGSSNNFIGNDTIANNDSAAIYLHSSCVKVTITQNSIYNNRYAILQNFGNENIPYPKIIDVSGKGVSGITNPGYKVEVFADDTFGSCQGQTYLGSALAGANGIYTLLASISGSVTATATDDSGNTSRFTPCKDTFYQKCIFAQIMADTVGCTGQTVLVEDQTITVPGSSLDSWSWSFGDGTSSSEQSPNHIYADTGSYTISLYVTNDLGCSQQVFSNIRINASPLAFIVFENELCAGVPVDITNNSSGGINDSIVTFAWDFGDGTISSLDTPSHSYSTAGMYNIMLTVTNSKGCSASASDSIKIDPQPVASYTYDATGGHKVVFTNTSVYNPGATYTWTFGDGTGSAFLSPTHIYKIDGTYSVCLRVYDVLCGDSSTKSCQTLDILTGINNIPAALTQLSISPNPASSYFTLGNTGSSLKITSVKLISMVGEIMLALNPGTLAENESLNIHLPALANGIYMVKIESDKGILTKKIVLNKE